MSLLCYPSLFIHSRFGPRTIAMFPGVILFTSWCSVSLERNLIKYLSEQNKMHTKALSTGPAVVNGGNSQSKHVNRITFVASWEMGTKKWGKNEKKCEGDYISSSGGQSNVWLALTVMNKMSPIHLSTNVCSQFSPWKQKETCGKKENNSGLWLPHPVFSNEACFQQ